MDIDDKDIVDRDNVHEIDIVDKDSMHYMDIVDKDTIQYMEIVDKDALHGRPGQGHHPDHGRHASPGIRVPENLQGASSPGICSGAVAVCIPSQMGRATPRALMP